MYGVSLKQVQQYLPGRDVLRWSNKPKSPGDQSYHAEPLCTGRWQHRESAERGGEWNNSVEI